MGGGSLKVLKVEVKAGFGHKRAKKKNEKN